jgi:hypothetical protein
MTFRHIGSAYGREIFVSGTPEEQDTAQPTGYSVAGVVLYEGWKGDELGSLLNRLYGGIEDWSAFDPNAGARSFVFYGDRAEEAGDLCDAFAYAWTRGADDEYNDVIAASNDAADIPGFVEAMLSGEIAAGERYADKLKNTLFVVLEAQDSQEAGDDARVVELARVVSQSVAQHRFD